MGEKQRQLGIELAAANLRLSDANYVDNLRREGDRARLQEDISFTEKLQQSIFDENLALQKLKYKNQSLINASERDFNKALAQMGATEAIKIAQDNLRGDSERAMIGGTTGLVSAGVEAYGKGQKGAFSSDYQDYLEGLPEGTRPMSFTAWSAKQPGSSTFVGPTR